MSKFDNNGRSLSDIVKLERTLSKFLVEVEHERMMGGSSDQPESADNASQSSRLTQVPGAHGRAHEPNKRAQANAPKQLVYDLPLAAASSDRGHVALKNAGFIWAAGTKCLLFADARTRNFFLGGLDRSARTVKLGNKTYALRWDSPKSLFEIIGLKYGDAANVLRLHSRTEAAAEIVFGPGETSTE